MFKRVLIAVVASVYVASLFSCGLNDQIDKLNNIDGVSGNMNMSAAVVSATVGVKDLLGSVKIGGDTLTVFEDDVLGFNYKFTQSYTVSNLSFPDIPFEPTLITSDGSLFTYKSYDGNIATPTMAGDLIGTDYGIKSILLASGATMGIGIKSPNTFDQGVLLTLTFPTITKNGAALVISNVSVLANNTTASFIVPNMAGYEVKTKDGTLGLLIPVQVTAKASGSMPTNSSALMVYPTLKIGQNYTRVEGYFGKFSLADMNTDQALNIDLGKLQGSMVMKSITFSVAGNFAKGSSFPVGLNFTGSKLTFTSGSDVAISGSGILFKTSNDNVTFGATNIDLLKMKNITLKSSIVVNEGNESKAQTNVIYPNETMQMSIGVKIPINFTTDSLQMVNVGSNGFKSSGSSSSTVQNLDVKLGGTIKSSLPVGAILQIYFRNAEDGANLEALFEGEGITIPANGEYKGDGGVIVSIDQAKYDRLKTYQYQATVVKITSVDAAEAAGLKNSQNIKVNFWVQGQAGFNTANK